MIEFVLHKKQKKALNLVLTPFTRVCAYVGGIRSGKTIVGSHYALQMIIERPSEVGGILANTNKQLTKATLKEFKGVLASYNLYEGVDYLVNKNPERLFNYRSKFTDHAGVWSFWNGAQVFTFSLETQIRGVEFGWSWCDETQEASIDSLNIVLGRMSGSDNAKTFYTMTPPSANPDIDELIYGDNAIPTVFGTTYDNQKNLPEGYIETLARMYDKYTFAREVMCERVTMAGFNWLYSFDRSKHVSDKAIYNPKQLVYVSFDFNTNPYVCVLSHRGINPDTGKQYIHYFDSIELTPEMIQGKEYIQAIVDEVKARTPYQAKVNAYMITGDASGRSQSVLTKVGATAWSMVIEAFNISPSSIVVPRHNPTHVDSRVLCNSLFSNFPELLMHPKNKNLIRDCEFAKAKADGHRLKDSRTNVLQQLDLMDALVYDLSTFNGDWIQR
jgi:hypothetical protein